jgi:hypothetical protein
LEFRRSMVGKTISVVTLDNGAALSENYLKVALAAPRTVNCIETIRIGGLTSSGVCEIGALPVWG